MLTFFHCQFLLILVIVSNKPVLSYLNNGHSIFDLQNSTISNDVISWSYSQSNPIALCKNDYIVNKIPINEYISRSYSNLPVHNTVYMMINLWRIDSWEIISDSSGADKAIIDIDSGAYIFTLFADNQICYQSLLDLCGTSHPDSSVKLLFIFPHSSSSLTLKIYNKCNQSPPDEDLGISDLIINFAISSSIPTALSVYSSGICIPINTIASPYYPNFYSSSTCPLNCKECFGATCITCSQTFYYNGTTCTNCPLECINCENETMCTSSRCLYTEYIYWDYTCRSICSFPLQMRNLTGYPACLHPCPSSFYLFRNGSCFATCSYPSTSRNDSGMLFCDFPCPDGSFAYWNGTCASVCTFPLQASFYGMDKYCTYPCNTTTEYLYSNGTCRSTCQSPMNIATIAGYRYCEYPCLSNQFAYWNGSCKSSCYSPLVSSRFGNERYCNYPCLITEYLFSNGSCRTTCSASNFAARTTDSNQYCDIICLFQEYLYWNATCSKVCPSPFLAVTVPQYECRFPCLALEYLYWNGTCSSSCDSPLSSRLSAGNYFCDYPCNQSEYLNFNGDCLKNCTSPYVPRKTGNNFFCDFPCSSMMYLDWTHKCVPECNYPLVRKSQGLKFRYCALPCRPDYYLNYDASCSKYCNPPFYPTQNGSVKLCQRYCQIGFIYNYNGLCVKSCPNETVFRISQGVPSCEFKCSNDYYYPNGSCLELCEYPWLRRDSPGYKFCLIPCPNSFYLYENNTCKPSCDPPYRESFKNGISVCELSCNEPLFIENGECVCYEGYVPINGYKDCEPIGGYHYLNSATSWISLGIIIFFGFSLISATTTVSLVELVIKMQGFYFLLFLKIDYPIIFRDFLKQFKLSTLQFLPNLVLYWVNDNSYDDYEKLPSPGKFAENNFSGLFLDTSGGIFIFLAFIIVFYLLLKIVSIIFEEDMFPEIHSISAKMIDYFEWESLLNIWLIVSTPLNISCYLQIRTLNYTKLMFTLSSVLSLIIFSINFVLPFLLIYAMDHIKISPPIIKKYSPILKDYDTDSVFSKYFSFVLIFQRFLTSLSLVYYYGVPSLQNFIPWMSYAFLSLTYLCLMPHKKETKNILKFFENLFMLVIHSFNIAYIFDGLNSISLSHWMKEIMARVAIIMIIAIISFTSLDVVRDVAHKIKEFRAKKQIRFSLGKSSKEKTKSTYKIKVKNSKKVPKIKPILKINV